MYVCVRERERERGIMSQHILVSTCLCRDNCVCDTTSNLRTRKQTDLILIENQSLRLIFCLTYLSYKLPSSLHWINMGFLYALFV